VALYEAGAVRTDRRGRHCWRAHRPGAPALSPAGGLHRVLCVLLLAAVGVYATLCAALYLSQHRLVYLPDATLHATPAALGLSYQDRWITTADGARLHAWWIPAAPAGPVVLFLHGNAGNISHRLDTIALLAGLGASMLIVDYRGYGRSTGRPDEAGSYEDARAALAHLHGVLGVPADRVVVFGRSLGGGIASWLAAHHDCAALVLESTWTSLPDLAAAIYPLFPVRLLARIRYDSLSRVAAARCPVLVVHSRDDEIVPFSHGERLFAAAREPKQLLIISGGHNEGFLSSGARYRDGIARFLREALAAR
jgi:hypothetical protein